jgi:hypothetical protein
MIVAQGSPSSWTSGMGHGRKAHGQDIESALPSIATINADMPSVGARFRHCQRPGAALVPLHVALHAAAINQMQ